MKNNDLKGDQNLMKIKDLFIWIESNSIKKIHKHIQVTQVSCWVFTSDNKLILVSKDRKSWTITAGHLEAEDKTFKDTAIREVYEESGLDISEYKDQIQMAGYYVVKGINEIIQVRLYLKINESSEVLNLIPNEPSELESKVIYAKPFSIQDAINNVDWFKNAGDFIFIKQKLLD